MRLYEVRIACALALCTLGCTRVERPAGVANNSVWVASAKTGYWQVCALDMGNKIHCKVWNEEGTILMDEQYLPLDGGRIPANDDLIISGENSPGPYEVRLKNGRLLLPASLFDREKALIEASGRK